MLTAIFSSPGTIIGTVVAMPVSGILAETAIGWKLIFYSISGLTLITAAVWYFAAASSPEEHRLMGDEEQKYIEKGLKSANIKVRRINVWKKNIIKLVKYL